ncbi:hypothetical protein BRD17_06160 [Halobacteriales archaeon SW_7_68_16]|nr:MAG: hypothetical protein BRD17_06160 [Halobacteriales archaeon SW_7_68_16]
MIGIVESRADEASVTICDRLRECRDWTETTDTDRPAGSGRTVYRTDGFELRSFDELHLRTDGIAAAFDDPGLVVFASRHSGDTGPLLTTHFTGNVGRAEYGGEPGELARAAPAAARDLMAAFDRHAPEGYDVGIECTHHGPSDVGAPSLFAELGSDADAWTDPDAARAVARAILDLDGRVDADRTIVGIGGGHYARRFERIARETAWAVGHVAADWSLDATVPDRPLRDLFEASGATHAVIDGEYPEIAARIVDLGYRVVSETWVRTVDDRPLDLVERLERDLVSIDDGLRFGDRPGPVDRIERLPAALLDEAASIDRTAAREAVAAGSVALVTAEGGTRPAGRVAVPDDGTAGIVDDLVAVLRDRYDAIDRKGETVVATKETFDPAAARDAGVPEGPAFGRLADGEPVTIDGETIEPAAVLRETTDRFPL